MNIYWFVIACFIAAIIAIVLMVSFFTSKLSEKSMTWIFRFGYAYSFLILLTPIVLVMYIGTGGIQQDLQTSPISLIKACVSNEGGGELTKPKEILCYKDSNGLAWLNQQWLVNIGGSVSKIGTSENLQIEGGLVTPLYVLIISIFGGSVSLMRRIPEYQRQYSELRESGVSDGMIKPRTAKRLNLPQTITRHRARELVVFQIMQVTSAPLIAIVAYHVFSPSDSALSASLAFIAGFASERILLQIRKATQVNDNSKPSTQS